MLLSSHLLDLKEITHDFLYEQYRTERLSRGLDIVPAPDDPASAENSQPGTPRF